MRSRGSFLYAHWSAAEASLRTTLTVQLVPGGDGHKGQLMPGMSEALLTRNAGGGRGAASCRVKRVGVSLPTPSDMRDPPALLPLDAGTHQAAGGGEKPRPDVGG